jgi:hypothetical protein
MARIEIDAAKFRAGRDAEKPITLSLKPATLEGCL